MFEKSLSSKCLPLWSTSYGSASPPRRVPIAVYGSPATGKKSLISALNKRVYCCPQDGRLIVLDAKLGREFFEDSILVALILVDAQEPWEISQETVDAARNIASSTCVVPTSCLRSIHDLPCRFGPGYFPVNLSTGEGIDDILEFIGTCATHCYANSRSSIIPYFWDFWSRALDFIAGRFALSSPAALAEVSSELAALTTDADIQKLMETPLDVAWGEELKRRIGVEDTQHVTVNRVSPSLIVKPWPSPSERATIEFVRQNTSIPVPRSLCPHLSHLVMPFVDGEMLYECWDKLNPFMQFRIACTLRLYTKQLRSLTSPIPGALVGGRVRGIMFDEYVYGPFADAQSFRQFCEQVAFIGWQTRALHAADGSTISPLPRRDLSWTSVFTHGDLNLSNIMLDRRGGLWILDWANAGFYPSTMESIVMRQVDELFHPDDVPLSWRRYRSFIAGSTAGEEEEFWDNFGVGLFHCPGDPQSFV